MLAALPRVGKVDKADWTKAFKQVWILAGGDAWRYNEETWGGAQRQVLRKPHKSIDPPLLYSLRYQFKAAPTPWLVHVADYIDGVGGDNITEITATTRDKVKNAIFAGMEREEGIPNIAARISDLYDGFEGYRATMIARSEVVDASNQASMVQARDAGSTLDLMWISSQDDRVRPEHEIMDGVTVRYDEVFDCEDGTDMPGQAVNCRCAIGYAIPET
jgi:SPP1 gp7 family putative phage head morphogenesis protein